VGSIEQIEHAIFALKVAIVMAPVAAYFLVLGIVNSQATPRLVSARADFLTLTGIFLPTMAWPVVATLSGGLWWLGLLLLTAGAFCVRALLPARTGNWVVYNASVDLIHDAVQRSLRRLGWEFQRDRNAYEIKSPPFTITVVGIGLLNAGNVHLVPRGPDGHAADLLADTDKFNETFAKALSETLSTYRLLPSPAGLVMVLVGATMMIVPVSMMSRHMSDIVRAITDLLLA